VPLLGGQETDKVSELIRGVKVLRRHQAWRCRAPRIRSRRPSSCQWPGTAGSPGLPSKPSSRVNRSRNPLMSTRGSQAVAEPDPCGQGHLRCPVQPDQRLTSCESDQKTHSWGRVGQITEINWKQIEKPLFGRIMDALLDQICGNRGGSGAWGERRQLRVPRLKLGVSDKRIRSIYARFCFARVRRVARM
jgi:hypothetical protein